MTSVFTSTKHVLLILFVPDKTTIGILKLGVTEFNTWRRTKPSLDIDLAGADLRGAELEGADLASANLTGANLCAANLTGATLEGAQLDKANLEEALIQGADFTGASLVETVLLRTDAIEAIFHRANLTRSRADHAEWSGVDLSESNLTGANLAGIRLTAANLTGANLSEACLNAAQMSEANLLGAKLVRCTFDTACLVGACLQEVRAFEASFLNTNLSQADGQRATFHRAQFEQADLSHADLTRSDLYRANLTAANCQRANLHRAKLNKACLKETDLTEANASKAAFTKANLNGAKFQGTNLRSCKDLLFSHSFIKGIRTNNRTKAPWLMLRGNYSAGFMALNLGLSFVWFLSTAAPLALSRFIPPQDSGARTRSPSEAIGEWDLWQLLLGFDKGFLFGLTSSLLLAYTFARLWITLGVSKLKDQESQTDVTPALDAYRPYTQIHSQLLRHLPFFLLILILTQVIPFIFSTLPTQVTE